MPYRCFTIMILALGFSGSAAAAEPSLQVLKERCRNASSSVKRNRNDRELQPFRYCPPRSCRFTCFLDDIR